MSGMMPADTIMEDAVGMAASPAPSLLKAVFPPDQSKIETVSAHTGLSPCTPGQGDEDVVICPCTPPHSPIRVSTPVVRLAPHSPLLSRIPSSRR